MPLIVVDGELCVCVCVCVFVLVLVLVLVLLHLPVNLLKQLKDSLAMARAKVHGQQRLSISPKPDPESCIQQLASQASTCP